MESSNTSSALNEINHLTHSQAFYYLRKSDVTIHQTVQTMQLLSKK